MTSVAGDAPPSEAGTAEPDKQLVFAQRLLSGYYEKFDRYESQELVGWQMTNWLLSTEDFKLPTDTPHGLIEKTPSIAENYFVVLAPVSDNLDGLAPIDYREIHQILRELTIGLYGFNQVPSCFLEANVDEISSCQIPPAYIETKVGQLMICVDYMIKGIWHGSYFPKDKRSKFVERWRGTDSTSLTSPELRKTLLNEYIAAGLLAVESDPDFGKQAYVPLENEYLPELSQEERKLFTQVINDVSMQLTLSQRRIERRGNVFTYDPEWVVEHVIRATETEIDFDQSQQLITRLQRQRESVVRNLLKKPEIRRQLELLHFTAFITPLLIGMRKRMRIPDLQQLLPPLGGEEVKTERELPPLVMFPDYVSKHFPMMEAEMFYSLHGGIQLEIETCDVTEGDSINDEIYEQIQTLARSTIASQMAFDQVTSIQQQQDLYTVPIITINNTKYRVIPIAMDTYYPQAPQKPQWVRMVFEDMVKFRLKKLPIAETHVHEQFKRYFGLKRAIAAKNPQTGLKICCKRGLVAMHLTLSRKTAPARLGKQDEQGMSLIHHAALNNRSHIITSLILNSMDVNVRRFNISMAAGSTALHFAAQSGAYEAVSVLLANFANHIVTDEKGWAAIHRAAYFDHKPIVRLMIWKHAELKELPTKNDQRSPILLSASSGALETLKCLMLLNANMLRQDIDGNTLIHLAALCLRTNVLEFFIDNPYEGLPVWQSLIDMLQQGNDVNRRLSSVKCLELLTSSRPNAFERIIECEGIAALHAQLQLGEARMQMLQTEGNSGSLNKDNAGQSSDVDDDEFSPGTSMSRSAVNNKAKKVRSPAYSDPALQTLTVPMLIELVRVTCSVLCNITEHGEVRIELTKQKATPTLIYLLKTLPNDEIRAKTSIILADLACIEANQNAIAEYQGIDPLVRLLDSDVEDVLVNAVNTIRVLATNHSANQALIVATGSTVDYLIEFLALSSNALQTAAATAIAALAEKNRDNQMLFVERGVVGPLVDLVKGKARSNIVVQLKAASAIEQIATDNPATQQAFLKIDTVSALIKLLKQIIINMVWSIEVKEQSACALWALAGSTLLQQKDIAEKIGIHMLLELLLTKSERLQHVSCMALRTLCFESIENQNKVANEGGIEPLLHLLRSLRTSDRVLSMCMRTLISICIGVAHTNNPFTQKKIVDESTLSFLVQLLKNPPTTDIQIQAAHAIAAIVLNNQRNQGFLKMESEFNLKLILKLLESPDPTVRLQTLGALSLFALNNTAQQYQLRLLGGVPHSLFLDFLSSDEAMERCHAAYQMIVLARVIIFPNEKTPFGSTFSPRHKSATTLTEERHSYANGIDEEHSSDEERDEYHELPEPPFERRTQVDVTADGIVVLLRLIEDEDADPVVVVQTCSYLSTLIRMRYGIAEALISILQSDKPEGSMVLDTLIHRLYADNMMIRSGAGVTISYLSFNATARRLLLSECRKRPDLYKRIMESIKATPQVTMCPKFIADFEYAQLVGLPSQFLEVNGGRPVSHAQSRQSIKSAVSRRSDYSTGMSVSASVTANRLLTRPQTTPAVSFSRKQDETLNLDSKVRSTRNGGENPVKPKSAPSSGPSKPGYRPGSRY